MSTTDTLIPLLVSAVITCAATARILPWLHAMRVRKEVRIDTPESHQSKQGTPSMGGIAILAGILLTTVAFVRTWTGLVLMLVTLSFGLIGLWDDWTKATGAENRGIKARHKLALQMVASLIFVIGTSHLHELQLNTQMTLWDHIGSYLWGMLVIIGTGNAANITDGLDGLVSGLTVITASALGAVAVIQSQPDAAAFCACMAGAGAGFLVFNTKKALIFMGDTGSLALGAGLAASSLLLRCELLLPLFAMLFLVDALSVILQVGCFKMTRRRIFRMAPIHHGLEMRGWSEWSIVLTFWIVGALVAASTLVWWRVSLQGRLVSLFSG